MAGATEFDRFARILHEGLAQELGAEVAPMPAARMPAAFDYRRDTTEAGEGLGVGKPSALRAKSGQHQLHQIVAAKRMSH